jgi:PIN domain nuclease of toxin-antitoxin system
VKLLLDTHALLWWLAQDSRLGGRTLRLIEDLDNEVLVSVASLWELAVKIRAGKLRVDLHRLMNVLDRQGITRIPITASHLLVVIGLPTHHRDPFDHLLIAQAIVEGATFISSDRSMRKYPVRWMAC